MDDALATRSPPARRVLLVDDEDRFATQLRRLLIARGFDVVTAGDGRQALDLVGGRTFDAVVLDIRMPVMDGMTALGRIQAKKPAPPVIMLTGHATLETGIEAIRRGAFDYLMKPCGIEDLVAKLEAACTVGQIRRRPILWPRRLAGELILNAFRRIEDGDPLLEAFSILNHRLPRMAGETLFVVDADDCLAGHLSKQDIVNRVARFKGLKALTWEDLSANPQWLPDVTVGAVMISDTLSVDPATPLKQVAKLMMDEGIRTLPVTCADRRVLGVIRLRDVLVYLDSADGAIDTD
ncbi:hypothetical protein DSCA_38910 [Desulfosarcina alkanivorans]|uniref:Response regulator n=1 Tax=Desulfosarcina alkanivorans TaxID=571177 RepID=A0A5K7YSJ9_9BACT|nr:response regulator [Desulfosarcina alkanivorans]BBO69961.1 hypothetical protein DSCA_38910 [Desulfosarcina alkanivorans]